MEYKVPHQMNVREALSVLYPDSSRRTLQNWLIAGRFSVDGKLLKRENELLEEGTVLVSKDVCQAPKVPGIKILYEDRHLIAIEKPVGLLSVPLDEEDGHRHALGLLRTHFRSEGIYAVHRIDRDVSGVLLFARGKQSEERLKDLFEAHDLHRQYFAIVQGRMKENKGVWKSCLTELPNFDVVESADGKEAITHFEVVRRSPKYTYVHIVLETGRKHQIRVHCQMAGHPILGDSRYGSTENPIRRLCLHSLKLELVHPFTKKRLSFSSPIPAIFKSLGGSVHLI
jgi:tRNA pseudouridine32 synthase/23S rRNA pseudouridine746 synthase/23S rRNA pseudouridine1911/1915/1917 synthase